MRPISTEQVCLQYDFIIYVCMPAYTVNPCVFFPLIVDLLESFENHPPIVLPSAGFKVDLESECVEDSIYRQLLYVRHFVWGLRTKTHPSNGCADRQDAQVNIW